MLTQDVVKIRKKGKKPLKASEKVAEIKDIKASIGLFYIPLPRAGNINNKPYIAHLDSST